jgi:Xaa-Pro aminopeptidase
MNSQEVSDRRKRLCDAIGEAPFVATAYNALQKSADMAHVFIQEASFLWLTGISEPGWQCVIEGGVLTLIAPERDEVHTLFDGGLTDEEAIRLSGANAVLSKTEGDAMLKRLSNTYPAVYSIGEDPHAEHYSFTENGAQKRLFARLEELFTEVKDARLIFAQLRALKSEREVNAIRKAIAVSIEGFKVVHEQLPRNQYEYEIEAELNSSFRKTGAEGHAYEPIVASGAHACTLHYATNNDALPRNGLLLIDAGAKVEGYAADITRTYAIGTPNARQIAVHEAVKGAHFKIIDLIKPGVTLKRYQHDVDEIMKDALESLGLLKDRSDEKAYRKYFPHAVGHGLGLDVHESLGGYGEFKPGMVLTVEPGIYIPEEGIGVRIEDDILVTEAGNENLSAGLPTSL